jgi:hypothetical protein
MEREPHGDSVCPRVLLLRRQGSGCGNAGSGHEYNQQVIIAIAFTAALGFYSANVQNLRLPVQRV